jgi:triosephosphate isomerase
MTQRKPLVAGNWKMNGSLASVRTLVTEVCAGVAADCQAQVALCPPAIYIPEVSRLLADSPVALGAQNVSDQESGAFTGEISAAMLQDYHCRYVIVGHSERRNVYGESDEFVARKFARAVASGLTPILCVGELLQEREAGTTEEVIARQLDAAIHGAGMDAFNSAVIAYEPVWAIGTGRNATPEQAQEVHAFIRLRLARNDDNIADRIRILYGGSVKADNAKQIFSKVDVDGGLIGGASLKAQDFLAICRSTE